MSVPDYQTLMRPVLALLTDGKAKSLKEVHDALCEEFKLTPEERKALIPSGKQTVMRSRVGWARTYLNKAGLLVIPEKAHLQITDLGLKALKECPDKIDNSYLKQYQSFLEFVSPKKTGVSAGKPVVASEADTTPEEQIESAYELLNKSLADELLSSIKTGTPLFFEKLVVELMLAMGYGGPVDEAGVVTPFGGDDGIDGVIKEDRLGLDIIYLQAKRWKNTVHRPEIDKFIGSLTRHSANKGVFITTSDFSAGCLEAVKHMNMKVVLIDGPQLADLMIEHNLGVTRKDVYEVKQIDTDYFSEEN